MRAVLLSLLVLLAGAAPSALAAGQLPPGASTSAASNVADTTATVSGTVDPSGADTTYRFQYGTSTSYGLTTPTQSIPAGAASVDVSAQLSGLTATTTYHFRLVATNAGGTTTGADRTFRTAPAPSRPSVSGVGAAAVTPTGATLQGRVAPGRQATTYAFDYGTTTAYGASTPVADAGSGDVAVGVSAPVAGLQPNTTYHVRLRAANATGTVTSGDATFRTAKVPLVLVAQASSTSLRYGTPLTITGVLSGTDRQGVPVVLVRRGFPFTSGFGPYGPIATSDASGVVRFTVPPFTTASQFRLTAPSRGLLASGAIAVGVRAAVKLRVQRLRGGRLRLSGRVAPGGAAGTAAIQARRSDGHYALIRRVALRPERDFARFSAVVRSRRVVATYRVATHLTGSGALTDGRSDPRRVAPR